MPLGGLESLSGAFSGILEGVGAWTKKIIDLCHSPYDMAKSLGQIHSVDLTMTTDASGDLFAVDLPGQLTEQLQRTVRAGTYHKLVGIDLN